MRLWSLHPRYLDSKGLTAAWREALLARAVLTGQARGYRAHPQLVRFAACAAPGDAIDAYLAGLYAESLVRGFAFDATKLRYTSLRERLPVTRGQVDFELRHLRAKLLWRDPARVRHLPRNADLAGVHPLFQKVPGPIEAWERGSG